MQRNRQTVGIVLLTREAREVDDSLFAVRMSILGLFCAGAGADGGAVLVSLAHHRAADPAAGRRGARRCGRARAAPAAVPRRCCARGDEVGELARRAGRESAAALWARMDAIEQFAADVAHEIKNPLSSIRSAIETLRRIEDPGQQRRLLAIIAEDVIRLDRLISDISDASPGGRRALAHGDRAGGRGADPGAPWRRSTTRPAARATR